MPLTLQSLLLHPKINSERSITLPYNPRRVNAELLNVQAGGRGGVGGVTVSQRGFVKGVGRWELKQKQPCKGGAEQQPDKHGPADLLQGARLKLTEARERSRGSS